MPVRYIREVLPFRQAVHRMARKNLHSKGYTVEVRPAPTVADLMGLCSNRDFTSIEREFSIKGSPVSNRWLMILGREDSASVLPSFKRNKDEAHFNGTWKPEDPFAHNHPHSRNNEVPNPYPSIPDIENWRGPLKGFHEFVFDEYGIVKIVRRQSFLPSEMRAYDKLYDHIVRDMHNLNKILLFSSHEKGDLWLYMPWRAVGMMLKRHGISPRGKRSLSYLMGDELKWLKEIRSLERQGMIFREWTLPEYGFRMFFSDLFNMFREWE